jgi:acetyl esterase/lipase
VLVDVVGYFTGPSAQLSTAGLFIPQAPQRLLDTRSDAVPLWAGGSTEFSGSAGSSAWVNFTLVDTLAPGFLTARAAGQPTDATSTTNATLSGQTIANAAIVGVSNRGVAVTSSAGSDVLADIAGTFTGPTLPALSAPALNTPACHAAVLVHGGGYYMGDGSAMDVPYRARLEAAGWKVWSSNYPLLAASTDVTFDPTDPWYPRSNINHVPAQMRLVHDRAVVAVVSDVRAAIASGCAVTLLGYSAGGSIVLDLATKFRVASAVVVSSSTITAGLVPLSPVQMFYGGADLIIQPQTVVATCARWALAGKTCDLHFAPAEAHSSDLLAGQAIDWALAH